MHYINRPKARFAFEVSYIQDGSDEVMDGWLVNDDSETDCYMLIWIDRARTDKLNRIVADDFEQVTICFVTKKSIISYLRSYRYTIDRIKGLAKEMRTTDIGDKIVISPDAVLYYTRKGYSEQPINILIERDVLCRLSHGVYDVSREEVIKRPSQRQ